MSEKRHPSKPATAPAVAAEDHLHPDSLDSTWASWLRKGYEPEAVAGYLRSEHDIGPQTRAALADLLEGKLKRPAGRQKRTALDEFKDLHSRAPLALMLIDGIGFARRQGRDMRDLPNGGPSPGQTTREYVASLLGISESSLESLLKFAATKGVRIRDT